MGVKRQPREVWFKNTRSKVFERDGGKCVKSSTDLTLYDCHINYIQSGRLRSNHISNLRALCSRCHVLRVDNHHRDVIAKALSDRIIPTN